MAFKAFLASDFHSKVLFVAIDKAELQRKVDFKDWNSLKRSFVSILLFELYARLLWSPIEVIEILCLDKFPIANSLELFVEERKRPHFANLVFLSYLVFVLILVNRLGGKGCKGLQGWPKLVLVRYWSGMWIGN